MSKEGLLNNDRVAKAFKSLIIFPKATMLRKYMKFDQHLNQNKSNSKYSYFYDEIILSNNISKSKSDLKIFIFQSVQFIKQLL